MTKKIGLFVDVSNVYYCISKKFPSRKLDYAKFAEAIKANGELTYACAYGTLMSEKVIAFITALKHIGFQTFFRRGRVANDKMMKVQWDVGLALNVVDRIADLDTIVIASSDAAYVPLVEWCKKHGKEVVIYSCGINRALREHATSFIEIDESVLEEEPDVATSST